MAYDWITDALEWTWNEVALLTKRLDESDFDRATPCPGWTVRDIVSHLTGFELMLAGREVPSFEGQKGEHVKNPIGELNEAFVEQRRTWTGREVVEEFSDVTDQAVASLRARPAEDWEVVGWSPEGDAPFHRFMETRLLDSWIHLQDLRDALAMPMDDHGVGEEVVINRFEAALPYVIGRKVAPGEGTTVRINLEGRLARSTTISVLEGRARAVEVSRKDPDVEITTPVALFWRRMAGRISSQDFLGANATHVSGDDALARRVAEAMVIMI